MIISRSLSVLSALCAVSFASTVAGGVAEAGVTHASHRAFYEIRIGRVDPGSTVVDARGRMVAEWQEACDGWTTTQRLAVSMAPGEGEPINSEVKMTAFERLDGTAYTFDSETRIGGELVEAVQGKAERPGPGQPGSATYDVPRGVVVDFPGDTVFPFEHTIAVLEAAERGDRREFSYYFDGSQPDISPMASNSLILGKARDGTDGSENGFGALSDHPWWPVRLAMFNGRAATSGNEEPEFEMTQILQNNGVVRKFEFDYGTFSLVAALVKLEEIERPKCG
jgi:hypothetical protein